MSYIPCVDCGVINVRIMYNEPCRNCGLIFHPCRFIGKRLLEEKHIALENRCRELELQITNLVNESVYEHTNQSL